MNINEIRSKLQQGKTINEVCKEYQLTFKQLFRMLNGGVVGASVSPTTEALYITKSGERYVLIKNGTYYGTYYCLEDAIKVRDYFIYNGWRKDKLDKVCTELDVVRSRDVGRKW